MRCYYVQLVNLRSGVLRHYWPDLTLWGGGR
jgi:hypothetical protein